MSERQHIYELVAEPIAIDLGTGDVSSAMQTFLEFLQLPEEFKTQIIYEGDGRRRNTSAGYSHSSYEAAKGVIDTNKDNKHLFQYTPDIWTKFEASKVDWPREAKEFLDVARDVWEISRQAETNYLSKYEDKFPGLVGLHLPQDGVTNNHLRFLAYEPGVEGNLARGHYDKSTGTIAIAESCGGLRLGVNDSDLALYQRDHNEPVFFHGLGWTKLHKQLGRLSTELPAWHDVVETDAPKVSDEILRWALIYFINPAYLDTAPTSVETHTPLSLEAQISA